MTQALAILLFVAGCVLFAFGLLYMTGERIYWEVTLPLWAGAAAALGLGRLLYALDRRPRENRGR